MKHALGIFIVIMIALIVGITVIALITQNFEVSVIGLLFLILMALMFIREKITTFREEVAKEFFSQRNK